MTQHTTVREFMKRLQEFEITRDVSSLASLFSQDAELSNLTRSNTHTRQEEVSRSPRDFWRRYRASFDHVSSHFTHIIGDGDSASLEWSAQGALPGGMPIEYCGVSVLELEGDLIRRFRAYYDSAAFFPHAPHGKPYAETVGDVDLSPQISS